MKITVKIEANGRIFTKELIEDGHQDPELFRDAVEKAAWEAAIKYIEHKPDDQQTIREALAYLMKVNPQDLNRLPDGHDIIFCRCISRLPSFHPVGVTATIAVPQSHTVRLEHKIIKLDYDRKKVAVGQCPSCGKTYFCEFN